MKPHEIKSEAYRYLKLAESAHTGDHIPDGLMDFMLLVDPKWCMAQEYVRLEPTIAKLREIAES